MPRDLGERAQDFRNNWLAISGGWLAEISISLSDTLGVWDLTVLTWIFVGGWIVIRTSPMEVAMILGLVFDMTIPLQYTNKTLSSLHERHLEKYWPMFMIATLVEGGCFFLIHPDLFTLIVCLKTTFTLFMWLSKDEYGDAVSKRSGSRSAGRPSSDPRRDGRRPERDRDRGSGGDQRGVRGNDGGGGGGSGGGGGPTSSSKPANLPECKHTSDPWKYLGDKYSPEAVYGMIDALNKTDDQKKARQILGTWGKETDPTEIAKRNKKYADVAAKAGWKPSGGGGSGSGGGGDSGSSSKPTNIPECKFTSDPWKHLGHIYTPEAVYGMVDSLNKMDDEKKARGNLGTWAKEKDAGEIAKRNKKYGDIAKKKGWKPSGGSAGGGKLGIAAEEVKRVASELKKLGVSDEDAAPILGVLKNPQNQEQVTRAAKTLEGLGIKVKGASKEPLMVKYKFGEVDPNSDGLKRDILLDQKVMAPSIVRRMLKAGSSEAECAQWENYLKQPLSRKEVEERVIPQAAKYGVWMEEPYFGGGKHGFDQDDLKRYADEIQQKTGVTKALVWSMIRKAIVMDDKKKAKAQIDQWRAKGVSQDELKKWSENFNEDWG